MQELEEARKGGRKRFDFLGGKQRFLSPETRERVGACFLGLFA
jgi:hypothetical protein